MGWYISATTSYCLSEGSLGPFPATVKFMTTCISFNSKLPMYGAMHDFRLLPWSGQELHSSGVLCSE